MYSILTTLKIILNFFSITKFHLEAFEWSVCPLSSFCRPHFSDFRALLCHEIYLISRCSSCHSFYESVNAIIIECIIFIKTIRIAEILLNDDGESSRILIRIYSSNTNLSIRYVWFGRFYTPSDLWSVYTVKLRWQTNLCIY